MLYSERGTLLVYREVAAWLVSDQPRPQALRKEGYPYLESLGARQVSGLYLLHHLMLKNHGRASAWSQACMVLW